MVDKSGFTVPMGVPGEVWFKGYNVMRGYWNDEEMTKKAIVEDGWLRSGYFLEHRNNPTRFDLIKGRFYIFNYQGYFNIKRRWLRRGNWQNKGHNY